jgi:hydroxymethylpyrimidine pyrophosphatase-like HAD family hydrolase
MYIFDLDGTLAKTRENRKLSPEEVIEKTKIIYLDLNYKKDCIVVSGRDEKQRRKIYEFLGLQ